jgi:ATP-binding cassette subfamily G (WHITE) protein 2 (SNQ2)
MPKYLRYSIYLINPGSWMISGLVTTELHSLPVVCTPSELNYLTPPAGLDCGTYMKPFFDAGGLGYLENSTSTSSCGYCAYSVGDDYYQSMEVTFDERWRYLGIFAVFLVSNTLITWTCTKYLNWSRR